jgi:hypothetical protein
VLPNCFVPVAVAVIVAFTITSFHLFQFYGALSHSSDAPILGHFYGVAHFSTLVGV